jgi:hypothetical protein
LDNGFSSGFSPVTSHAFPAEWYYAKNGRRIFPSNGSRCKRINLTTFATQAVVTIRLAAKIDMKTLSAV